MNTSTPSPLLGNNVSVDSKSGIGFLDIGSPLTNKYPAANNPDKSYLPVNETLTSVTRKLIRTDSTFEEDSFDESIRDLSHLNQRQLRQQWFRKNNLVSRLRRSTSTASNSSSSSSGISSNIYSSCNATNASSSFASSFSSSFSATLSSLSESCDNDPNISSNITSNENHDYPKILRKSSFKNKFTHCYKPYYRPRRFSLQLLKNNLELPENMKFLYSSSRTCFIPRSVKYSTSCYSIGNKDKRCLYAMAAASAKSNPSSPNKNIGFLGSGHTTDVISNSMTATVLINSTETEPSHQNNSVVNLIRSKSLDDLNTLFCYPSNCLGHEDNIAMNTNLCQQNTISHYSSFNRIFDPPKNVQQSVLSHEQLGPTSTPTTNYFSNHLSPMGFNGNNNNNNNNTNTNSNNSLKGISISSNQINNGNNSLGVPTTTNNPTNNNNSLCDMDHVMKKISSLRV